MTLKLVCIGDSLTFGYGVFRNQSWVELVKTKLCLEIINKGVNGDTTAGMLSRSYSDVIKNNPTHVIILGGCNDFLAGRSLKMVEGNLKELIKEALHYNIIPIVGIELPIDKTLAQRKWSDDVDYDKVNKLIEDFRIWILEYTEKNNIVHIDFYNHFLDTLKIKDSKELYIDGLHPTALGHELMANCVMDVLSNLS